jgi:hypothetical protein
MGISIFLLLMSLSISGRAQENLFVAIIGAMMGATNAASSMILKWKLQFACALVWWATMLIACFGSVSQSSIAFLAAIFLCQIVFGGWMMVAEGRAHRQGGSHA